MNETWILIHCKENTCMQVLSSPTELGREHNQDRMKKKNKENMTKHQKGLKHQAYLRKKKSLSAETSSRRHKGAVPT